MNSGEKSQQRFAPEAARELQEQIQAAGGREVFFAGSLNARGLVEAVRVCARGNKRAVTALLDGLELREVVIHNHPSGNLEPSDADLELASIYSTQGHGVYIIDNEATRVYVVVEPFVEKEVRRLDVGELSRAFLPASPLARNLSHFEVRPQQREMMEAVAEAFNENSLSVIEAPTGVGKTLAYLLPAALWAMRNKERIVVSTRTINLQEQIVHKDVPVLQRIFDGKPSACLVKGRGNYLCLRKLNRALSEATLFEDDEGGGQLQAIADWAETTEDGSLSNLPFVPGRELWDKVCSETDACSFSRCPDPKKCFVGRARREMAKADLLVVNHHMLFADVAVKKDEKDFSASAVLPSYRRIILDEAHSIEDSATEYFGISATYLGALNTFGRLYHLERGKERGLLPLLKAKLIKECTTVSTSEFESLQHAVEHVVQPGLDAAREAVIGAFTALRILVSRKCKEIGRDVKWRLTESALQDPDVQRVHGEHVLAAVAALDHLIRHCLTYYQALDRIQPEPNQEESPLAGELPTLMAYTRRLENLAAALREVTQMELAENTVRWIEIDSQNERIVRIVRCPLEVAEPLARWLYEKAKTVVMTSATLAVRRKFSYLFQRLGLDLIPQDRVKQVLLDSPFDFMKQAMLCIPTDMPEPSDPAFLDASVESIRQVLRITKGHAFVLFTSFYALDYTHKRLQEELRRAGITPLRQGEAARTRLLEQFREDSASVLFATDSFWEGVDVAGDSLQCVILPKLPFRVPTEPILEARAESIEAAGGNAFTAYSVPQAVIKFRQGFGRLIRRRSDRGAIVVLDRRIITKYYGRMFLESLPPLDVVRGEGSAVMDRLHTFFQQVTSG